MNPLSSEQVTTYPRPENDCSHLRLLNNFFFKLIVAFLLFYFAGLFSSGERKILSWTAGDIEGVCENDVKVHGNSAPIGGNVVHPQIIPTNLKEGH